MVHSTPSTLCALDGVDVEDNSGVGISTQWHPVARPGKKDSTWGAFNAAHFLHSASKVIAS